jgi:hypothetical protein
MKKQEADAILQDVSLDRRIQAQVDTRYVRASGNGYRVQLVLRKLRVVTIRGFEEWPDVKKAWTEM